MLSSIKCDLFLLFALFALRTKRTHIRILEKRECEECKEQESWECSCYSRGRKGRLIFFRWSSDASKMIQWENLSPGNLSKTSSLTELFGRCSKLYRKSSGQLFIHECTWDTAMSHCFGRLHRRNLSPSLGICACDFRRNFSRRATCKWQAQVSKHSLYPFHSNNKICDLARKIPDHKKPVEACRV